MKDYNMAEQLIDFGQSSEPKYSLRGFLNKQETPMPIAQDIAQAITVTHNAYKAYSQVEDEAQQAKYFNANIEFNNLKKEQQDALLGAGEDVNKIRETLDAYRPRIEGLSDKYELSDKYKATLGGAIESHNSGWEEKYRGYYNAQQDSVAKANIAEVASNMIGNSNIQDTAIIMQALKEYYKITTGKDDRTASTAVANPYINAKLGSIDPDSLTWQQAKDIKKDLSTVLTSFDNKITSDAHYREALNIADRMQEEVRKREEGRIADMVKTGTVPQKVMNTVIDKAIKDGIIQTPEQAELYKADYQERLLDKEAKTASRELMKEGRTVEEFKYLFDLSKKPPEEAKKFLDGLVSEGKLRRDRADYLLRDYERDLNTLLKPKIMAENKEAYARLKTSGGTEGLTSSQAETLARSTKEDGSLGVDDIKFLREFKFREVYEKAPKVFINSGLVDVPPEMHTEAVAVANSKIDLAYQSGDFEAVSKLHNNYGAKGNIEDFFSKELVSPKDFQATAQKYERIKADNPASYEYIVGKDNALKIETIKRLSAMYGGQVTPDIMLKAEQQMKQPIDLSNDQMAKRTRAIQDSKITDIKAFNSDITGYMQTGMPFNDALKKAEANQKANTFGTFNFTGVERTIDSKAKGQIEDDFKVSFSDKQSKIKGASFNKATGTMWWSEAGNTFAYDTKLDYNGWVSYLHTKALKDKEVKPETLTERFDRRLREDGRK